MSEGYQGLGRGEKIGVAALAIFLPIALILIAGFIAAWIVFGD